MMPTTPSPHDRPSTPPAPLHGAKFDDWQPYVSRRITRRTNQSIDQHSPTQSAEVGLLSKPRSTIKIQSPSFHRYPSSQTLSPPSSPEATSLRASRDCLNIFEDSHQSEPTRGEDNFMQMLPTPRKTPRKTLIHPSSSAARILNFKSILPQDILPTPKKRKLRMTLESPPGSNEEVQIYTDSQDRIPTMEDTNDNPFFGKRNNTTARKSQEVTKARNADEVMMEEAVRNGEGLIYTFRGRKMLRRFTDSEDPLDDEPDLHRLDNQTRQIRHSAGDVAKKPITRSTLKPRLLFAQSDNVTKTAELTVDEDEEEAETDIEHDITMGFNSEIDQSAKTVISSSNMPIPAIDVIIDQPTRRSSPFDSWPRQKRGLRGAPHGIKRSAPISDGDVTESAEKRTRSGAIH